MKSNLRVFVKLLQLSFPFYSSQNNPTDAASAMSRGGLISTPRLLSPCSGEGGMHPVPFLQ